MSEEMLITYFEEGSNDCVIEFRNREFRFMENHLMEVVGYDGDIPICKDVELEAVFEDETVGLVLENI